jgi:hypothetical protein
MSEQQVRLFNELANFSTDIVYSWVDQHRTDFGNLEIDALIGKLIPFAEYYFNYCVDQLHSLEDVQINTTFDKWLSIDVGKKYHKMDLLQLVVMLSLHAIMNISIDIDLITRGYISGIIMSKKDLANELTGCGDDHVHEEIKPGEKIYEFSLSN